jgi:hypothetical protein
MEKRAADMLEQSRADGKGPLFSDQQLKLLADMCAAEGNDAALYLEAYTAELRKMLPAKASGEELVAWMEESVKHPPPYKETVEHYKRLRNRSGGDTMETLEKCYQELLSEAEKAQNNQYSEKQVNEGEAQLNQAWRQYTNCLNNLVRNKVLSDLERQNNFNKGNGLVGDGLRGYRDRQKALKVERSRKKLEAAQDKVKQLLNMAEQVDEDASSKDLEYLINENTRRVADLEDLVEEAGDSQLAEEASALQTRLTMSSRKLRKQQEELKAKERPKPNFTQQQSQWQSHLKGPYGRDQGRRSEDKEAKKNHWYQQQTPGSSWADEMEKEPLPKTTRGGTSWYNPSHRRDEDEDEEDRDYFQGRHRDPFISVLDKLANRMDRPARPPPPAWPVFTDEYQKFPKWKKDITSYLKDYCSSLKEETKVLHLKERCFSKKTVILLDSFETLDQIFVRLEQIYRKPACYTVEAMRPFQNQKLKSNDDSVGLESAYQRIVRVLRDTERLGQMSSLAGPECVWKMTHSLSQNELAGWEQYKQNNAADYDFESECFLDFSTHRLAHWSNLADVMRSMTMDSGSAPAAKPAGGHQDGPKKGGHSGRDDRKAWNKQSRFKSNQSNPNPNSNPNSNFNRNPNPQVYSAVAQSQGTQQPQQQPQATGGPGANSFRSFKCQVPGCESTKPHTRRGCHAFLSLPIGARWDIVTGKDWCQWCLAHTLDRDCFAIKRLAQDNLLPECGEGGCKMAHHPALHHVQVNTSSLRLEIVDRSPVEGQSNANSSSPKSRYFLVPQLDIVFVGGIPAVVQYDGGSQSSSISAQFVSKQGIAGTKCDVLVNGLNDMGARVIEAHSMPIQRGNDGLETRLFFELPSIGTGSPMEDLPEQIKNIFFPGCEDRWAACGGMPVDIVIGMDNADLFPKPIAWRDGLTLSVSILTNLFIVWGREERIQRPEIGPLTVNEFMPEADIFTQSMEDTPCPEPALEEDDIQHTPAKELPVVSEVPEMPSNVVFTSPKKVAYSVPILFLFLILPLLLQLCSFGTQVNAFSAFDCQNRSNRVTAYSLIEPESCHGHVSDLRFVRVLSAEIIQVKKTRIIPISRCLAVESEFSQYCGHSSAAGVLRILKFRENRGIESDDCRKAFSNQGKIVISGKEFLAKIGEMTSHSEFLTGDLDDSSACTVGTHDAGGKKLGYQTAQRVLEVSLFMEQGEINDAAGTIKLPDGLLARYKDETVRDSRAGTFVWSADDQDCPSTLTQIFRGDMKFHVNVSDSSSLQNGMAVLERADQVAGLELTESFPLCHHAAWRTHLRDVIIVIHGDNFSSVAKSTFDPSAVSELTRLESEISFLHVKNAIGQKEVLRQVKLAICQNRREILTSRMESIAGTDSQYALNQVLGRGVLLSKAGGAVYVTRCNEVNVEPRVHTNCTLEIPAIFNGSDVFVDPISSVIKPMGTVVKCNDVAPPRFLIEGAWYCSYESGLRECHAPRTFPLSPLDIGDLDEPTGLGRSLYTQKQMEEFYNFQNAAGTRTAFIADQADRAFDGRSSDGQWGLALGDKAKEMMLDAVGLSFVPLYRVFGPVSMLLLLLFFIVGVTRITLTIIVRAVIITRARGCGPWILAAVWGTVYHVLITPVRWADNTARNIAEEVGHQMEVEATDESGEVYPVKQLKRAKASALASLGMAGPSVTTSAPPPDLSEFSYRLQSALNKDDPKGHTQV